MISSDNDEMLIQSNNQSVKEKDKPIHREFSVSLEDLFHGTTKKYNITKHIHENGNVRTESKQLEIHVMPGWKSGTKIIFPREGDVRDANIEPADMIFILREKPHAFFKREKDNLVYIADITLKQALCGVKLFIPTFDGEQLTLQILEPISNDKSHIFPHKGMPNSKTKVKGDLIVSLDKGQKEFIKNAFQDVTSWK